MEKGIIFNIQKFSVHDGPGIRTTVFFKGCPLNCLWCHNPESQNMNPEVMYYSRRCVGCGACASKCPNSALSIKDNLIVSDIKSCTACGLCVKLCPSNAREIAGYSACTEYVMDEIRKDLIFYEESGGGVTFSGGEPLMQYKFLSELLCMCRQEGIDTALDTSGYAPWQVLERISSNVNLFLYDIKLMDDEKHKRYTGVSNEIILENIKKLSSLGSRIFARIPIVPGINDDKENISLAGSFLSGLNIEQVNLLPYHNISADKYSRLSREYELKDLPVPSEELILNAASILKSFGLKIKIGG